MRLWHFVCVITITTSTESDLSCFGNGPYLANDAYQTNCNSWMGELEEARARCNADPRCSVIHDYNCDGKNWRWCMSDLATLEAFPGTDEEQETDGAACSEINVICTTSTATATTASTGTATTTTALTTVTNLVPCFVDGPDVTNDFEALGCSTEYLPIDQAEVACGANPNCTFLHDWSCDERGWRQCNGDVMQAPAGDAGACTRMPGWCEETYTSVTVTGTTQTSTETVTKTSATKTGTITATTSTTATSVTATGTTTTSTTSTTSSTSFTATSITATSTTATSVTATGTTTTSTTSTTSSTSITATSITATSTTATSVTVTATSTTTTATTSTTSSTSTTSTTSTETTLTTTTSTTSSTGTFASRSSIHMAPGQSLQVAADPIPVGSEGTVSFWVKLISLGTVATHLISAGAQSTDSYGHASFIEEGVLKIYSNAASGQGRRLEIDPNPIPMNVWTHVCYTFDPAAFVKLYIDGQALGVTATSVTWGTSAKLIPGLAINMPNSVPNNVPGGLAAQISGDVMYDEVTLWPRALNIIEVLQVFRYVVLLSSRAWWRFEDSLADSSGNALSLAGWNAGAGSFSADTAQEASAGTTVDDDLPASSTEESSTSTASTRTTSTTSTSTSTSTGSFASRSSIRMAPGQSLQVAADPIPAGGEGTVSFWVKLVSLGTVATHLISAGAQSEDSYGHASFIEDGVLKIYSNAASGQGRRLEIDPNPIPMDAWTHVCYTFNPAALIKLYIDGQAIDGAAASATWGAAAKLTPGLTINMPNNVPSNTSGGLARQVSGDVMYDEVALWPRVLNIVEVLQVFRYVMLVSSRAWWRFEDSLADSSGNALSLAGWNAGAGTFSAETSQAQGAAATTTTAASSCPPFAPGPRVANGIFVAHCSGWSQERYQVEAACGADPNCQFLHDYGCDGNGWRYCTISVQEALAQSTSDQGACTMVCPPETSTTATTHTDTGTMTSTTATETMTTATTLTDTGTVTSTTDTGTMTTATMLTYTGTVTSTTATGTTTTATTLTNTGTMTSTTGTETMTTETSVTSFTSVTSVTTVKMLTTLIATATEAPRTLTATLTATSAPSSLTATTTAGLMGTATTATSTATVTNCYRDSLRVWNEAYHASCRPWYGTLDEAVARCDADEECTFLHDWACNDVEWRVCFGNLQEIHDTSADFGACTKVCERHPEPLEEVTVSGSLDMTVANAGEFVQDAVAASAVESAVSEVAGVAIEMVEITIFIVDDARRLGQQEARRAQEAEVVRTEYRITVVNVSSSTRISERVTNVTPDQLAARINHYIEEAAGGSRTYDVAVTDIAAPTLERVTLTTTTDPDATFTTGTTTTTLDIRYVDGPRVGNSAHSAHCSSWVGTFAQAAARCDDEPDCGTLHAVNCSHAEWRFCAAGLEELSVEDNSSDACTKVRVPPEDRIVATGVIRMTASSSGTFVGDAGVDAALRESIAAVVSIDAGRIELSTYEVGDLRRLDLRSGKRRLQGASPVHSRYAFTVAGANTGADACAALRSVTPEGLTSLIQTNINATAQDTTHIVTVASLPECRIEVRRTTTVTTTSTSWPRDTVWYSSASSDLSQIILVVILLLFFAAVCILVLCCCWNTGQGRSEVTPLDSAVPSPSKKVFHDEEIAGPNGNGHGKVLENGSGLDHRDGPHGPPVLKSANWSLDETQGPFEEGSTMTPPNPPTTCDTQPSTTRAVSPHEISVCESQPSNHLGTNPDPPPGAPEVPRCAPEPRRAGPELHKACREVHTTTISSGSWPRDEGPREPLPPQDPPPCLPPPMLPPGNPVDLFDRMDRNHDGVVTREEFDSFMQARQNVT